MLIVEQALNGLQFGLMLFLLAAGLTLVFGVMDMINLAHGSLYMVGAFLAAWLVALTGSFVLGVVGAVLLTGAFGMVLEVVLAKIDEIAGVFETGIDALANMLSSQLVATVATKTRPAP